MARREKSVYSDIANELGEKIKSGVFGKGMVLPSERLLSEKYGVQRTTVRRALEILCEMGLVVKKAGVGTVVANGDEPVVTVEKKASNAPAHKALYAVPNIENGKIIYVYPDAAHAAREQMFIVSAFLKELENACTCFGAKLLCVEGNAQLKAQLDGGTVGVVFSESIEEESLELVKAKKIPAVLAFSRDERIKSVGLDNESAVTLMVNELYEKGHRSIAFVGSDESFYGERVRRLGFVKAMLSLGLDASLVNTGGSDENSGYHRTRELLRYSKENITAVCAVNDEVARGAVKALNEMGKRVPQEVSVCGFGGDGDDIFSAGFDLKIMAAEIVQSLCFAGKSDACCGCFTEVSPKLCGESVCEAPRRNNGRLSDFLL